MNSTNQDLNQKIQDILNQYKIKEEENQRKLYELEAQQKILEENIEQQKQVLKETFGTDDLDKLKEIKNQYEKELLVLIEKIEQAV